MFNGSHCSCLRSASGIRASLLINPHGLAGVPSISHPQALPRPPYSLTAPGSLLGLPPTLPYLSRSCLSTSILLTASLQFSPHTGHPAIPGLFSSVSLHVLCLQAHPSNALHPSFPSSSRGTKPKSPLDSLSILLVFAALGDHFPCCNAISCICLSSPPDSESLESKCCAHLFSIVPDQQVLHKCLLTDRMHEVSVLSAVSKDLYVTVYPHITQRTLFPLCLY